MSNMTNMSALQLLETCGIFVLPLLCMGHSTGCSSRAVLNDINRICKTACVAKDKIKLSDFEMILMIFTISGRNYPPSKTIPLLHLDKL